MANCNDCLHHDMCVIVEHSVSEDEDYYTEFGCDDYKPTADVVEVVRCKDCMHWGGVTYGFVCRKFSGIETKICMGADHFCSYGERKENK